MARDCLNSVKTGCLDGASLDWPKGHGACVEFRMTVYGPRLLWAQYAIQSLREAGRAAKATGQLNRLHLWPDHEVLSRQSVVKTQEDPGAYLKWLWGYWNRVSEWPWKTKRKLPLWQIGHM